MRVEKPSEGPLGPARIVATLSIATVVWLQLSKLLVYFRDPGAIFDVGKRLTHVDFPTLEYQMETARRFFDAHGTLWGYDPFFLAGYPLSFLWNSNVFLQVLAVVFGDVPNAQLLKICFAGILVVEPWLLYAALRNFGFGRGTSMAGALVGLLYLKIAQPLLLLVVGVMTGYLVFPVFLYATSLLLRVARSDGARGALDIARLTLVLALGLLVHKTFLLLMLPVCIALAVDLLRRRDLPGIGSCCGAFALAFVLNAFWIVPALRMAPYVDFAFNTFFQDASMISAVERAILMNRTAIYWGGTGGVLGALNGTYLLMASMVMLFLLGFVTQVRERRELECAVVAAPVAGAAFLVLGSAHFALTAPLHGVRFYYVVGIVMLPTIARGLARVWDFAGDDPLHRAVGLVSGIGLAALALVLPSYESVIAEGIEQKSSALFQRSPLFAFDDDPLAAEALELREWLQRNVPKDEVVFLSTHPGNHYLAGLYAGSGVRFATAPYTHIFLRHNYVGRYFQDIFRQGSLPPYSWGGPSAFGHEPTRFSEVAPFFNVKWWVVDRAGSSYDLRDVPRMAHVETLGDYEIHYWDLATSDFLLGAGDVEIDYEAITIRNATPDDGRLVLKFHWFEEMSVSGAAKIIPFEVVGYPLPFVQILGAEPTVVISLFR